MEVRGYYRRLKELIERMYEENGNKKVTIVAHSMGGPVSLYFLTSIADITQKWKDKYISSYITLSGAWSGGNKALEAEISGYGIGDFFLLNRFTKPVIHTLQSIVWLLPRASVWNSTVLVKTPKRNYTANDYKALFRDAGFRQGYSMYKGILDINKGWPAPNVTTHCFYGVAVPTDQTFIYDKRFPKANPVHTVKGDGDGTVNIESSQVCLRWAKSKYLFESATFHGVSHKKMVTDRSVLKAIGNIVGVTN